MRARVQQATHLRTGLQVLDLAADDSENLFAAAFATPPTDNTGVAHILEHAVLGGSKRFPLKDPFLEMLKSSMATFINAMTYPDHTVYPVASNVRQDFFNLVDVYLDALFAPALSAQSFAQEGHHLEFENSDKPHTPLVIQGVVYNEMKGSFAELDTIMEREISRRLLADTCYAFESGGHPDDIPSLTFSQFMAFYRRHYHPANARVFFYGDIPLPAKLAFLDRYLAAMPLPPPPPPPDPGRPQQLWSAPRHCRVPYPVAADDPEPATCAITLTWLVGDISDPLRDLAMEVLDHVLLGDSGAPLYKALIDSHLGEGLAASGHDSTGFYRLFQAGLKGTAEHHADAVSAVILDTLQTLARDGLPQGRVLAAFNQIECSRLDIGTDYPLQLMDDVFEPWLHGLNPLLNLRPRELVEDLLEQHRRDPRFFESIIQADLLDNPHRLTAVFVPQPGLLEQREHTLAQTLKSMKEACSGKELTHIATQAQQLRNEQDKPNPPDVLAALPRLRRHDLPRVPRPITSRTAHLDNGVMLLQTDLFANGMDYLQLAFSLDTISRESRDIAPLLGHLLTRLGTRKRSFVDLSEQISLLTGDLSAGPLLLPRLQRPEFPLPVLVVAMQSCERTFPEALRLLQEILLEIDFSDTGRLLDVLNQRKISLRNNVLPNGHYLAALRAGRPLSAVAGTAETWYGATQLLSIRNRTTAARPSLQALQHRLRNALDEILAAGVAAASFSGNPEHAAPLAEWLQQRQPKPTATTEPHPQPGAETPITGLRQALSVPSDVAYVARTCSAPHSAHPDYVPLTVFSHLLQYGLLWEEIRVKGGAYGGFCSYDPTLQTFSLMSYRDPHILKTLDMYRSLPDFVAGTRWSEDDIERAVISCAKHYEYPIRPRQATASVLRRALGTITEDVRAHNWHELLTLTPQRLHEAVDRFFAEHFHHANVCVMGTARHIRKAGAASAPFACTRLL